MAKGKLTAREAAFVDAFMGQARGNATKAAEMAGFKKGKGLHQSAHRMLRNADVGRALAARAEKRAHLSILTAAERDAMMSRVATACEINNPLVCAVAVRELNTVEGRRSSKVHVTGNVSLEAAVDESRQK